MRAIVDRIEEDVAVLIFEDGGRAYVPAAHLPAGAGEGTVLRLSWTVDSSGAAEVSEMIERLRARTEEHLE
ncbi:MAG TPA: DUF3006 domain-containing protein [bacterium]|jgi:hypothetical protein|nr:DUF3006 domain-containing protein [bacterium]